MIALTALFSEIAIDARRNQVKLWKKKKSKKKIIIGAAAVLVVAGGVTVAGQRNSKETQIPQVPVVTAEMGDVEEIVDATGTVGSEEEKTYYSPVNAELKNRFRFFPGRCDQKKERS